MIILEINGEPKAQPRARAYAMKFGNKYSARMYDSDSADEWKAAVDSALMISIADAISELVNDKVVASASTAFKVTMAFDFNRPKSHYKKNGGLNSNAPKNKTSKPDCDNLAKLILDRITRCNRIWHDDSQVVSLLIGKRFVTDKSSVLVVIEEATDVSEP